ncbi:MAG: hypothetical protein COV44_11635 [Deltaproteobacteria bacterium CG11_big_fil_rev_8_21_14_0_20_45_16]|nr:MAG: hypothetical protein COV44_11635 [Deltaproteobacteria bacterium CG11_big_fil_rev_8_21_14_0_20_45_16]
MIGLVFGIFLIGQSVENFGDAPSSLNKNLKADGNSQTFATEIYLPESASSKHSKLVVILSGAGFSGDEFRQISPLHENLLKANFVIAYPHRTDTQFQKYSTAVWQAGECCQRKDLKVSSDAELAYLKQLPEWVAKEKSLGINFSELTYVGFSDGAAMAYRLACAKPPKNLIAVGGFPKISELKDSGCDLALKQTRILQIHGQKDKCFRFKGGRSSGCLEDVLLEVYPKIKISARSWIGDSAENFVAQVAKIKSLEWKPQISEAEAQCYAQKDLKFCQDPRLGHAFPSGNFGKFCEASKLLNFKSCRLYKDKFGPLSDSLPGDELILDFLK